MTKFSALHKHVFHHRNGAMALPALPLFPASPHSHKQCFIRFSSFPSFPLNPDAWMHFIASRILNKFRKSPPGGVTCERHLWTSVPVRLGNFFHMCERFNSLCRCAYT